MRFWRDKTKVVKTVLLLSSGNPRITGEMSWWRFRKTALLQLSIRFL